MNKRTIFDSINAWRDEQELHPFVRGKSEVPVSGAVISNDDIISVVDAALDGWFTEGKWAARFSDALAKYVGVKHAILCNSGSSADLLAISAISEKKRTHEIMRKHYAITCATGFPTTIAPCVQNGLIPIFIDIDPKTLNPRLEDVLDALAEGNAAAVILAHTLGFPIHGIDIIRDACKNLDAYLIEDTCDGLGGEWGDKKLGSYGNLSTLSFFPAHQITTGEGGAVLTDDDELAELVRSYRDWGRDCHCLPGQTNTCGKRFEQQFGALPYGYDHKYVFSRFGYNLKMTELQAALGWSQAQRIDEFKQKRQDNYLYFMGGLNSLQDKGLIQYPYLPAFSSPFGFPITTDQRGKLVQFLENRKIRTRPVFAGNITRHPMFDHVYYETFGNLSGSDYVMNHTFWVGCHPALTKEMLDWTIECIWEFFK